MLRLHVILFKVCLDSPTRWGSCNFLGFSLSHHFLNFPWGGPGSQVGHHLVAGHGVQPLLLGVNFVRASLRPASWLLAMTWLRSVYLFLLGVVYQIDGLGAAVTLLVVV